MSPREHNWAIIQEVSLNLRPSLTILGSDCEDIIAIKIKGATNADDVLLVAAYLPHEYSAYAANSTIEHIEKIIFKY